MFVLFFNLYLALMRGDWHNFTVDDIATLSKEPFNAVAKLITSIFGEFQVADFGDIMLGTNVAGFTNYFTLVAFVLALITSIGIVVVATKGIKKLFTVFFYGVR